MNLPTRYIKVICTPKDSEDKPFGIFDKKLKELVVLSENGFAIWNKEEILSSFDGLQNENGIYLDLDKLLNQP